MCYIIRNVIAHHEQVCFLCRKQNKKTPTTPKQQTSKKKKNPTKVTAQDVLTRVQDNFCLSQWANCKGTDPAASDAYC